MAQLIKAYGTTGETFLPTNGTAFTLEELQKVVGGYIEALYLTNGKIMFLNEDGKRLKLPHNRLADVIAHTVSAIADVDHIVGDVLICTRKEAGEEQEQETRDRETMQADFEHDIYRKSDEEEN